MYGILLIKLQEIVWNLSLDYNVHLVYSMYHRNTFPSAKLKCTDAYNYIHVHVHKPLWQCIPHVWTHMYNTSTCTWTLNMVSYMYILL